MPPAEPLKVYCAHCREFLYVYKGDFAGKVRPQDFVVARAGVAKPGPGVEAKCPACAKPFYLLRRGGAIIILTNQGYKPRAPDGSRFTPPTAGAMALPLTGMAAEYRDPKPKPRGKKS